MKSGKGKEISAIERVRRFYAAASPVAQELAGFLAAAPLTLPVMRTVQDVMLPKSRQVHLAEVFLGGLLRQTKIPLSPPLEKGEAGVCEQESPPFRKGGPGGISPSYNFHPGVRDLLLDTISVPEAIRVLREVSRFFEDHLGQPLDFQAWIADPTKHVDAASAEGKNRPFALLGAKVLRRMGGKYAELADRLEREPTVTLDEGETIDVAVTESPESVSSEAIAETSEVLVSEASETDERFTNALGMEFVYIPPGTFMMGSPEDEPGRDDDETLHKVTLTKGFYMQITQVTQAQWEKVMGNNPSHFKEDGENRPVEKVSWEDAQEFIARLNQAEGAEKYRLPTEAEWEYACRAGTDTPFYFGKCLSTDEANYDGNYPLKGCPKGEYRGKTVPVASFDPNAWGLYDMHGNVWEWVQDWYGDYPTRAVTDPVGPGTGSYRVGRGGGWYFDAGYCRSAARLRLSPDSRDDDLGFRLVLLPGQR